MTGTKQILIIGTVWPEPTSSAAGSRMYQLITSLIVASFDITFVTASPENAFTEALHTLGCTTKQIALNDAAFDDFVHKLNPYAVIFDRFMTEEQFGWRVMEQCPEAMRILDTEDFHGLRQGRALALKQGERLTHVHLLNDTTKRELASMFRCDLNLIISEAEMRLLKDLGVPESSIHYIPFMVEPSLMESSKGFKQREHFVTIGNFKHPPNEDAVYHLKEAIWPLIRKKLPHAELHVYGAYAAAKHMNITDEAEGFIVKGSAKDAIATISEYKVLLAPLRFGAGLKGKLIDAMLAGTPMMMSTIAAEGMFGNLEPKFYIDDDPAKFTENAVHLYTSNERWDHQTTMGKQCLEKRFNLKEHALALLKKMQQVDQDLDAHRLQNIVGQVLQHQHLLAHRYMSKWIAEKNKN